MRLLPSTLSTNHQRKGRTFRRRAATSCAGCIRRYVMRYPKVAGEGWAERSSVHDLKSRFCVHPSEDARRPTRSGHAQPCASRGRRQQSEIGHRVLFEFRCFSAGCLTRRRSASKSPLSVVISKIVRCRPVRRNSSRKKMSGNSCRQWTLTRKCDQTNR